MPGDEVTPRGTTDPATANRGTQRRGIEAEYPSYQGRQTRPEPVLPSRWKGPRRHTIVLFSGWEKNNVFKGAREFAESDGFSAAELMREIRRIRTAHVVRVIGLYGVFSGNSGSWSATEADTIGLAARFIERNYDPGGSLIVYGYSAGGVTAQNLARAMQRQAPIWTPGQGLQPPRWRNLVPVLRTIGSSATIDLLVTIDAAAGVFSNNVDRSVPPIVRRNLNYYQTDALPDQDRSKGGPNVADDPSQTVVDNRPITRRMLPKLDGVMGKVTHYSIGELTNKPVLEEINTLVTRKFVPVPDRPKPRSGSRLT